MAEMAAAVRAPRGDRRRGMGRRGRWAAHRIRAVHPARRHPGAHGAVRAGRGPGTGRGPGAPPARLPGHRRPAPLDPRDLRSGGAVPIPATRVPVQLSHLRLRGPARGGARTGDRWAAGASAHGAVRRGPDRRPRPGRRRRSWVRAGTRITPGWASAVAAGCWCGMGRRSATRTAARDRGRSRPWTPATCLRRSGSWSSTRSLGAMSRVSLTVPLVECRGHGLPARPAIPPGPLHDAPPGGRAGHRRRPLHLHQPAVLPLTTVAPSGARAALARDLDARRYEPRSGRDGSSSGSASRDPAGDQDRD